MRHLQKTKFRVEAVLSAYPDARENDKTLYKRYAQVFLGVTDTTPFFQVVEDYEINYDSIGRARRWFQAKGMYESTKQIAARRALMEEGYKEEFRRGNDR
jgi:hypothetical protein